MIVFAIALDLANLQQQSKINGFIRAVSLLSELNMMREKEQEPQNNTQILNRQHLLQFYHPCWLNAEQPVWSDWQSGWFNEGGPICDCQMKINMNMIKCTIFQLIELQMNRLKTTTK